MEGFGSSWRFAGKIISNHKMYYISYFKCVNWHVTIAIHTTRLLYRSCSYSSHTVNNVYDQPHLTGLKSAWALKNNFVFF